MTRYEYRFALAALLSGASFFSFMLALPLFTRELGLRLSQNGTVLGIFSLAVVVASPLWGALSDRLRRRKPFLAIGNVVYAGASALVSTANGFEQLLVLSALQGASIAASPMLTALFSDHFAQRAGRGFGFYGAANAIGWGLGGLVAGATGDLLGLRAVFLLTSALALANAAVIQLTLPEAPRLQREKAERSLPPRLSYLYLTVFVRHTAAIALWSVFPIYLSTYVQSYGLIGMISSINAFTQPLFMILLGRWSDHWNKLRMIGWSIVASILTFELFASAPSVWQIVIAQVLIAAAWSAMFIGLNLYLLECVDDAARGRAFGYLTSSLTLAAATGPLLGGFLSDQFGLRSMIAIAGGLMALSFPFLLQLTRSAEVGGSQGTRPDHSQQME